jgi:hypothetical protein
MSIRKKSPLIIPMRHDIDHKWNVDFIPKFVEIEEKNNCRSTFFIRTDAIKNLDYLLTLQDKGWEFGLHLSSSIKDIAEKQIQELKDLGFQISGLTCCGSKHIGAKQWFWQTQSEKNWKMLDSLGLDYICGYHNVPTSIQTPVIENGAFSLDIYYIRNYNTDGLSKMLQVIRYYLENYNLPIYPILTHPGRWKKSALPTHKYRFVNKIREIIGLGTLKNSYPKLIKKFSNSIIPYRMANNFLNQNKGMVIPYSVRNWGKFYIKNK